MKKRKLNKKKVRNFLLILGIVLLVGVLLFIVYDKVKDFKGKKQEPVKVVDQLKDYGYTLDDNETKYYKELFSSLKTVLGKDSIIEEDYAKLVGQLFLADFYNLDNKINRNDIGGTQFVYASYQSDFMKFAKDSIYHDVINNIYGDRKQTLPVVTNVEVTDFEQDEYTYLEKEDAKAYFLDLKITYKKDLGYANKVRLVLVHEGKKLEIAEMK